MSDQQDPTGDVVVVVGLINAPRDNAESIDKTLSRLAERFGD